MILLIGSEGNMGQRYKTIFNYIQNDYVKNDDYYFPGYMCYDTKHVTESFHDLAKKASGFLIATPTDQHIEDISRSADYGKPILCEKPISKNLPLLKQMIARVRETGAKLQMVNQYKYLYSTTFGQFPYLVSDIKRIGDSFYNYFKHGSDGLPWDCINILGLSEGECLLSEDSPFWQCEINGHRVDVSDMDGAYMRMILDWIKNPKDETDYILEAHIKAEFRSRQ